MYAKEARKQGVDIKLAIVLEMLGYFSHEPLSQQVPGLLLNAYPDKGNFIMAVGDDATMAMLLNLAEQYNNESTVSMKTNQGYEDIIRDIPGFNFSDH